jgi:uncharacterized protein HemX
MGPRTEPANDSPQWVKRYGAALAAFVAITILLTFAAAILNSQFESKAHAQEVYSAQDAALAQAKSECELRLSQSMGQIRVETAEIRGTIGRLEGNVSRIDATLQRVADKLGVAPVVPGFVPVYAPAKAPTP